MSSFSPLPDLFLGGYVARKKVAKRCNIIHLSCLVCPGFFRGGHFQETYGKSPLTPLFQRGGTCFGNQSFPPFEKGGQGGFIFKTKPNGQVSSLPFSTIVLSSTQMDSGLRLLERRSLSYWHWGQGEFAFKFYGCHPVFFKSYQN